jgi:hypothetical protein
MGIIRSQSNMTLSADPAFFIRVIVFGNIPVEVLMKRRILKSNG